MENDYLENLRTLSVDQVFQTHIDQCKRYELQVGVRAQGIMRQAALLPVEKVQNGELEADLFNVAATYVFAIIELKPFVEGNVQIAAAVAAQFLYQNDVVLNVTDEQFLETILLVETRDISVKELALFFEDHAEPVQVES